jgi:Fic family protein
MARLEEAYAPKKLSKIQQAISAAASHHRLLWIHPFLDGNGRVARLMSYSLLMRLDIGSSIWSIARGLSRRVDEYKTALAKADMDRRNDLDGRGTLSLEHLRDFCKFFLSTCKDQIDFMKRLLEPGEILRRIEIYISEEVAAKRLPKGSYEMLREAFYAGDVPRGRAPSITGYEERRARETVSVLLEKGLLMSSSHRSPVSIGFPHAVLDRWLPNLFVSDRHRENP